MEPVKFFKLTSISGDTILVNPNNINTICQDDGVTCVTFNNDFIPVKETPEQIIKTINLTCGTYL